MNDDVIAYASRLQLSREDIKRHGINDAYGIHRIVYQLYDDIRTEEEKRSSVPSGFLYADKGGDMTCRTVLTLSSRPPRSDSVAGVLESKPIRAHFLMGHRYGFEITINPGKRDKGSGAIIPIRGRENVEGWFLERASSSWGFDVNPLHLQTLHLGVQRFVKGGHTVTHGSATLRGELRVVDRERFRQSFLQGIGRGRAFGFGLLQVVRLG